MNLAKPLSALVIGAGLTMTTPAIAQDSDRQQRVDARQDRQAERIDRGVASGNLTAREATRLEVQQNRIDRYEARSRADGPGLTAHERARLENKQDRASRTIFRKKNNNRTRP